MLLLLLFCCPVISKESKARIESIIESSKKEGATLLLDGRGLTVPNYEKGNFVGPTIIADVKVFSREQATNTLLNCFEFRN